MQLTPDDFAGAPAALVDVARNRRCALPNSLEQPPLYVAGGLYMIATLAGEPKRLALVRVNPALFTWGAGEQTGDIGVQPDGRCVVLGYADDVGISTATLVHRLYYDKHYRLLRVLSSELDYDTEPGQVIAARHFLRSFDLELQEAAPLTLAGIAAQYSAAEAWQLAGISERLATTLLLRYDGALHYDLVAFDLTAGQGSRFELSGAPQSAALIYATRTAQATAQALVAQYDGESWGLHSYAAGQPGKAVTVATTAAVPALRCAATRTAVCVVVQSGADCTLLRYRKADLMATPEIMPLALDVETDYFIESWLLNSRAGLLTLASAAGTLTFKVNLATGKATLLDTYSFQPDEQLFPLGQALTGRKLIRVGFRNVGKR